MNKIEAKKMSQHFDLQRFADLSNVHGYGYHFSSKIRLYQNFGVLYFATDQDALDLASNTNKLDVTSSNGYLPDFVKMCLSKRMIDFDDNSVEGNPKDIQYARISLASSVLDGNNIVKKTWRVPMLVGQGATASERSIEFRARVSALTAIWADSGLYYDNTDTYPLDTIYVPGEGRPVDIGQTDTSSTVATPSSGSIYGRNYTTGL